MSVWDEAEKLSVWDVAEREPLGTMIAPREPPLVVSGIGELITGDKKLEDLLPVGERAAIGTIIDMYEKPDEKRDEITKTLYYSLEFDTPPKLISLTLDDITKKTGFDPLTAKPEERGFFGKVAESWRRGDAQVMGDIAVYETAFEGKGNEIEALAALKKIQLEQALDPIEGSFLAELVYSGVEVVPGMARGYWSAIPLAFGGMATGAVMALVAGQVPPLTVLPEEIAAVPAGAIIGLKIGLMSGSALFWYKQGAGSMYASMQEAGYDPELSKHIAGAAAIPYAIVEFLQVSRLTPGMRRGALQVAQKSMLRVLGNAAKKYGTTWSVEVFEEVVQEIIQIVAEDTAGFLSDKLKLPEGVSGFLLERGRRLWETTKAAGKAMALLPIPGASIDIYTGQRSIAAEKPPAEPAKPPPTVVVPAPEPAVAAITPAEPTKLPEVVAPLVEVVTPVELAKKPAVVPKVKVPEIKPYQAEIGRQVGLKPVETAQLLVTAEERYRLIKRKETGKRTTAEKVELAFLSRYRTDVEALVDQITMPIEERVFDRPIVKGLTRAEIGHLGRKEQIALRIAQAKGLKVGYKQGVAETVLDARRSLDAFRVKEKISEKMRMDIANVVLTYVPKEKQGDYIRRILQAKTQTRVERLTEAIDTYLDKAEKRQAIRDFKGFVKGIKKKYRRGEVVLGQLPKKLGDKIIETLNKFDLAKITEKKTETLESRAEFVTRISSELANGFEQLNEGMDKDATDLLMMGTQRIDELKRLSQTYIGEIDTDQIKYIQASLEHLLKINELKGRAKERIRMEKLRTDINTARQEVMPAKEKVVELTGLLGLVRWVGVEGQSTIRTLVGLATGRENQATRRLLIYELDKANNNRKGTYQDFVMHFRKLAKKAGIEWNDLKTLTETTKITIGGKEIEIDYNNLLGLYALTQAEGTLRRLLKTKGLNITVYSRDEHGILNKKHIHRVGKPTLAELRTISELVPEVHKKLLNVHFKTNWEKQAPAINETSMAFQNYELARQEKYFHVSREIERVIEGRKADISVSIEMQSRGMPRTGGNARINIKPFTLEVIQNMQWGAAYHDMTIPMENARTLVANTKWREAMKKAGQQKALSEITRMLRRTQGLISDQSIIELTASRFLGTVGKSILSLRFSGSLVQTASVPAAVEFIDAKYLVQVDVPTPADIRHLKEIDPVLWMRWEGKQFDYALGMVGSQNAFEVLLFDHRPITEQFLFPYTAGDEVAITKLFMAAERQIEAETKLKPGTNEFQKAALDLLHEAMTTQPQWDMLHRSPLTSDPSVLARSLTMFMSARNAQYNVLIRAIDDYRKGRIDKETLSKRLAGVGMANMLVSLSRHLFKEVALAGAITFFVAIGLRKPPDEEEIKKEAIRIAKKVPIETAFNLVGLNAVGGLFVSMGYAALRQRKYGWGAGRYSDIRTGNVMADVTLDVMQTGIDFILFTDQLISGDKYKSGKNRGRYKWEITGMKLIDDIGLLIAYRLGLPYEGPRSDIIWPAQKALREVKGEERLKKRELKKGTLKKELKK